MKWLYYSYMAVHVLLLQVLADTVAMLGKAGIYTILDCHQDLLSPKFCGELNSGLESAPHATCAY